MLRSSKTHPRTPSSSPWTCLFLSTLLVASPFLASITHAQSTDQPQPNRRMGYAVLNDRFYMTGGFLANTLTQAYSLDLSTSWSADKAPWTKLKDGPALTHHAVVPITTEIGGGPKGLLLHVGGAEVKGNEFFRLYSVADDNWVSQDVSPSYPSLEGHAAVVDPGTGKVYIFGGYSANGTQIAYLNRLTVYDNRNRRIESTESANNVTALAEPGAVWLPTRQSFVLFGGSREILPAKRKGIGSARLDEYSPSSMQWNQFVTTGTIPTDRVDHCMAVNEEGTKVVVFGGSDDDNCMADIYILDVESGKWSKGPNAPKSRLRMACAIHKGQLIVVGGSETRDRETILDATPAIFNLNANRWTTTYNVDGSDKESTGGSSIGGIVGGVVAGLVVGGAVAFFVLRKRRARRHGTFENGTPAAAGAAAGATSAAVAAATISSNEIKHDEPNPSTTSPGATYDQDIQLEKLNHDPYGNQYDPHYAANNYGYASPQPSAYMTSYANSPSIGAVSSPVQQAEYLNYLRQDAPPSGSMGSINGGGSSEHDTTPLIPPPSAHFSDYSHSTTTEYHQAYYANNPYEGGGAYSQAGYGYNTYPTPYGAASPSGRPNNPQDYTNYVPPNGVAGSGYEANSGYVPPPLQ